MPIERNIEVLFGVRFVASEHSTGKKHDGRIDSLGLDENGSPVIFEYKRSVNENVINQGLFYLDWLLDHRAEFELLVMKRFGNEASEQIDWSSPRLVCVASDFTRYDEHAIGRTFRWPVTPVPGWTPPIRMHGLRLWFSGQSQAKRH